MTEKFYFIYIIQYHVTMRPLIATCPLLILIACGSSDPFTSSDVKTISASALDEATDAIYEESPTSLEFSPMLLSESSTVESGKTCVAASANELTVSQQWSGTRARTKSRAGGRLTTSVSATYEGTQSHKWTAPAQGSISCSSESGRAVIPWSDEATVNGLQRTTTVSRTRSRERTITTQSVSSVTKIDSIVSGQRSTTWGALSTENAQDTRAKTIVIDVNRQRSETQDGTIRTQTVRMITKENAPLRVSVTRSTIDQSLVSKTIHSGTLISTNSDATFVEIAFDQLKFDLTSDEPCLPVSGTVQGATFGEGDTEAISSFTLTFGADTDSSISYVDSEHANPVDIPEVIPLSCDLELSSVE